MKKTADSVKKAKGTHRQSRQVNTAVVDLLNDLTPPAQLSEAAKDQWKEIATTLTDDQLLTGLDRRELMVYCEEMADYWKYKTELRDEEAILPLKNGKGKIIGQMKNPKIDLADRALTNAHKIGMHFGLTPLSRTKIGVPQKKESTPEQNNIDKLSRLRGKVVPMQKSAS